MKEKEKVKELIESHFGLKVEVRDVFPYPLFDVIAPTGKTVAVIPVSFNNGRATTLALSSGFGGFECPLRSAIDNVRA